MSVFAHVRQSPVRELRVLVADDHAPTRDDVRRALEEATAST